MKVTKQVLDALCSTKLFVGVSRKNLSDLLEAQEKTIVTYKRGDVIYSPDNYESSLGFIIRGSVNVIKPASGVIISTLSKGEVFGAITLYSQRGYYVSKLVAATETKVLFIDKSTINVLMIQDKALAINFISYLSDGLYYLNSRIDSFTGGSAESRLASFLIESFGGYKTLQLKQPYTKLADSLDIGRASLYRAFDSFVSSGAIEKDGKYIRLLNEEKLREYINN